MTKEQKADALLFFAKDADFAWVVGAAGDGVGDGFGHVGLGFLAVEDFFDLSGDFFGGKR